MNRSRNYPARNRLFVYAGVAAIAAAVFPPTLIITAPALIGWFNGARRIEASRGEALLHHQMVLQSREYDRAVKSFAP